MAKIHFILQGKGGVGKSMIASLLYQALIEIGKETGKEVIAYDTDPINKTLSGFEELKVEKIDIMSGRDIDPRKFDDLYEELANAPENAHVIVDNGASSFVALLSYIKENDVIPTLVENGHSILFHTVITGGQAMKDTIAGMQLLTQQFPDSDIAVWLNPFFGEIVSEDGRKFEEFGAYKKHADQFVALISLPDVPKSTMGYDIEMVFSNKNTFSTAIKNCGKIAIRSRIRKYWEAVLELIKDPAICE